MTAFIMHHGHCSYHDHGRNNAAVYHGKWMDCLQECERQTSCVAVSSLHSAMNATCTLHHGPAAYMVQGDGIDNVLCAVKAPRIDDGVVLYPTELQIDLCSAFLAATILVAASTALLASSKIRHNWRIVQYASLPISFIGALIGVVDPGSPFILLSTIYPVKGLIDPSLDVNSMCRAAKSSGALRAFLPFAQALTHHTGVVVLVAKIRFVAVKQPFVAFLCVPLPLVGIVILEFLSWMTEAHIIMRSIQAWGVYFNYVVVLLQVLLAVVQRHFVKTETMVFPMALIAVGNLLFLVCAAFGYKKSTHEYCGGVTSLDLPGIPRQASVARIAHARMMKTTPLHETRQMLAVAEKSRNSGSGPNLVDDTASATNPVSDIHVEAHLNSDIKCATPTTCTSENV